MRPRFLSHFALAGVLSICAIMTMACQSSPDVRFYRLAVDNTSVKPASDAKLVIGIENLSANSAYDDVRIVYRKSPYRLDYYHYHRWSAPPSVLVTDALRANLQQGGKFKAVNLGYSTDADVLISGRVIAFEEVDQSSSKWIARIVLDLSVRRARDSALLWSGVIEHAQPLTTRSPEGVAKGMTLALRALSKRLQTTIITRARVQSPPTAPTTAPKKTTETQP